MEIKLPFGIVIGRKTDQAGQSIGSLIKDAEKAAIDQVALSVSPRIIRKSAKIKRERLAEQSVPVQAIGGRKTVETNDSFSTYNVWNDYSTRNLTGLWSLGSQFDLDNLSGMSFDRLSETLADLSPEVSKALWDFLLMCNPGYECKAFVPGTEDVDKVAQAEIDSMFKTVGRYHGTLGVFFDRLFKMLFLRGSVLFELVLADNGVDFVDIATPDTSTLTYKRRLDPDRGQVWTFGQKQNGKFVPLELPTVCYIPIHPSPDSIEGHALCTSAFFLAIFLMSILRDTKRVVQHQGYLRLDISIDFDKIKQMLPTDITANPVKMKAAMDSIVAQVNEAYAKLKPDDTYIHSSTVTINNPVGTVSADSLGAIDALFKALERMAVRALKTMPILMGTDQSRSETQANREYEIYLKGIESMQHYIESGMEFIAGVRLQAKGILADIRMRFAQMRAAEAMRDAQVDYLKAKVARFLYDCGIISQDEMAQAACGKDEADQPAPRVLAPSGAPEEIAKTGENPNPGEGRIKVTKERFERIMSLISERQPTLADVEDADDFWTEYAPEIAKEMFDADVEPEAEPDQLETVS